MSPSGLLLRFAIGCAICAVLAGTLGINGSNSWIPITAIFICIGVFAIITRSAIVTIEERLRKIEQQK
jgi:hypothetical protein